MKRFFGKSRSDNCKLLKQSRFAVSFWLYAKVHDAQQTLKKRGDSQ